MATKGYSIRNLQFMLYEVLDVVSLTEEEYFSNHNRDNFDIMLEVAEDIAAYEKIKDQLPADYETAVLEKTQEVVALFTGAPGIGPLKVYPKAEDYIAEHRLLRRGWVMEIYEVFNANTKKPTVQTTYIWPLQD